MRAWTIALKDILVRFRDRGTLFVMLIAPLLLAAIMGLAFGSFVTDDNTSPIQDIGVIIVNADTGGLGAEIVAALNSPELAETLDITEMDDLEAARVAVGEGEVAAAVYIPADFSTAVTGPIATAAPDSGSKVELQLFTDPVAVVSGSIVETILSQVIAEINNSIIASQVGASQALAQSESLEIDPNALLTAVQSEITAVPFAETRSLITITTDEESNPITNPLAYFAPSLSVFFLFLTMFDNISSIMSEREEGTLSRLLISDVPLSRILLGKIGGAFIIGVVQFSFLVIASRFLFGLGWGQSILGLVLMVFATVAAVTSLGTLLASFATSTAQANIIAGLITIIFAALGGSFFPIYEFPDWLQTISRLTLNRWAIEGFADLTIRNLPLNGIVIEAVVLFGFAVVFFSLGVWRFPRRLAR